MAVQKKSNAGDKPEEKKINWMQVGVVAFCIIIVVMCILSFSNFQNFFGGSSSTSGAVEEGNIVLVEYMLYVGDTPVFTSYGGFVAGYETNKSAYIPVDDSEKPYMILASEQNAMSLGVIGMNGGETKTVAGSGQQAYTYTKEDVAKMGVDFSTMEVGKMFSLDFPYTDEAGESATAMRTGVVTAVTDDSVTIQYGSDKIEVTFSGYLQTS